MIQNRQGNRKTTAISQVGKVNARTQQIPMIWLREQEKTGGKGKRSRKRGNSWRSGQRQTHSNICRARDKKDKGRSVYHLSKYLKVIDQLDIK